MKRLTLFLPAIFLVFGCQKDISTSPENADVNALTNADAKPGVSRPYKDSFCTKYQFIPGDGWVFPNPGPGYYPGKGKGYASYIGKATTYFNSYVAGPPDFLSGPASVNLFFAKKLKPYNVPDAANSVVVDDKGNSI